MADVGKSKCLFWLPEGPMLRVGSDDYKGFVLHIMDLNPERHTQWALSRKEMLRIGWNMIRAALRRGGKVR